MARRAGEEDFLNDIMLVVYVSSMSVFLEHTEAPHSILIVKIVSRGKGIVWLGSLCRKPVAERDCVWGEANDNLRSVAPRGGGQITGLTKWKES